MEKKLFVSPCGSDENPGTIDLPLATISGARDRIRNLQRENGEPVTVFFRGGDYYFTETVPFDESDSGTEGAPVTYASFPEEEVNFYGGVKVDPSLVGKAENPEILEKVRDEKARAELKQIDLSDITGSIPGIYSFGHTDHGEKTAMDVYVDGQALRRSRWPNDIPGKSYLRTADIEPEVHSDGSKTIFYDDETAAHVNTWSDSSLKDLYMHGFLTYDWTNETYDASGIDRETKSITLKGGITGYFKNICGNRRIYFFNLPEEIDIPGESYIDRENRVIYYYPFENSGTDNIFVATLDKPMLTFEGTKHIRFEGIRFSYMRSNAIEAEKVEDFTLKNCVISHTSARAAYFNHSEKVIITGCEVYDTANGGFTVSGGDRKTLRSGESVVENCEIHAVNRDGSTYGPGLSACSVGMIVRHNKFYDSIHEMIAVGTNDVLIENNEIFRCVTESSDMGAIYLGRNPSLLGIVIRNNYFHDIGNDYGGTGQFSIYIDDGSFGADIYRNLFVRASGKQYEGHGGQAAIMHHGVQFSHIHDNIFVDTAIGLRFAQWASDYEASINDGWIKFLYDRINNYDIIGRLRSVDFDSPVWHEHYRGTMFEKLYEYITEEKIREYSALNEDEFNILAKEKGPLKSNEMDNNVFVLVPDPATEGKSDLHDNLITDDTSVFTDYEKGDFTFTEDGMKKVISAAPLFRMADYSCMGKDKE